MLLEQVQNQLEYLYNIGIPERAQHYLIDRDEAINFLKVEETEKIPKELLLVRQPDTETVEVALFLDVKLLQNLEENSPLVSLNEKNLSDFCILIEGVSHFVYFLWKAYNKKPITQLEMELQAEIDKFVMLYFFLRGGDEDFESGPLFDSLFEDFKLFETLSEEKKERYLTASTLAMKYCYKLQKRFAGKSPAEMLNEIRQFYNFSQKQKIEHIRH